MTADHEVTRLLGELESGDDSAADRVFPLVYDELRRLARAQLASERNDHTLQATALVHEAYMRLVGQRGAKLRDRGHFFAIAARAMRRVLVDHARRRRRLKRGAGQPPVSLDGLDGVLAPRTSFDLIDLDEALAAFAAVEPEKARMVELRFFGGFSTPEVAELEGVSTRTAERYWQYARAWLYRHLTVPS